MHVLYEFHASMSCEVTCEIVVEYHRLTIINLHGEIHRIFIVLFSGGVRILVQGGALYRESTCIVVCMISSKQNY